MPPDDPLLVPYRVMRRLTAGVESPWPAELAQSPAGPIALVEVDAFGSQWPGWGARSDGHVLAPIDLVRRKDGHVVALPVCSERLDAFLARRTGFPLSDGERLTLAVSALRGLAEARELARGEPGGTWWLTDGGRPVAALHDDLPLAAATRELLDGLADGAGADLAGALREAMNVSAEPSRLARSLDRLEADLFAAAAAEPLVTAVLSPKRARPVATHEAIDPIDLADRAGLVERLARHLDADLADTFSRATTAVWRRFRTDRVRPGGKPMVIAGASATVVLAAGLLWPAGGPATADGDGAPAVVVSPAGSPSVAPVEARPSEPAETLPPETTPDRAAEREGLVAEVERLIAQRLACADDECRGAVQEDASAKLGGTIDLPSDQRAITLLDEFGGAAVLRIDPVSSGEMTSQLVVIVRSGDRWLLRDVHDVAERAG
jgi:hypothetical protein